MSQYLYRHDKELRDTLFQVSTTAVEQKISKVIGKPHESKQIAFDELSPLISDGSLPLERIPYTTADGVILEGETGTAIIIFDPPPMGSIHLMQLPSDRPAWHKLKRIAVIELVNLVNQKIQELDASIAQYEAKIDGDAPRRRMEQRENVDKLRQRLAEVRALSYMGKMELSKSTMILIENLQRELKEELEKSVKKN